MSGKRPQPGFGTTVINWVMALRFIPVILIVLPVSKVLRAAAIIKYWYRSYANAPEKHDERVRFVQKQVREKSKNGKPLCTARKTWFMTTMKQINYKGKDNGIELSSLQDILNLDLERKILRVEPLVNMGRISSYLNPLGYSIPVLPELDELTAGGLVSGYGIETSSHKYGLFMDQVESVDIVVASGDLVTCSRTENSDLFHSISWSLGSLGFIVAVDLRIIPVKPYVQVSYTPCTRDVLVERFTYLSNQKEDGPMFVEALLYNNDEGVLIVGEFSDNKQKLPVNPLRRFYSEWFYKQVEAELYRGIPFNGNKPSRVEAIPLFDWYHRHTFSLFWEMELILPFGNNPLFRYLLGWLMPPNMSLLKLTNTARMQEFYESAHVAQDFLVPIELLGESLDRVHDLFEVYPIWLCPHSVEKTSEQGAIRWRKDASDPVGSLDMYVDVGVYGVSGIVKRGHQWWAPEAVSKFEQWLLEVKGYSALYAIVELNKEEFEQMFDRELYDKMRVKWGAIGVFMDVYDKVKRKKLINRDWEEQKKNK